MCKPSPPPSATARGGAHTQSAGGRTRTVSAWGPQRRANSTREAMWSKASIMAACGSTGGARPVGTADEVLARTGTPALGGKREASGRGEGREPREAPRGRKSVVNGTGSPGRGLAERWREEQDGGEGEMEGPGSNSASHLSASLSDPFSPPDFQTSRPAGRLCRPPAMSLLPRPPPPPHRQRHRHLRPWAARALAGPRPSSCRAAIGADTARG